LRRKGQPKGRRSLMGEDQLRTILTNKMGELKEQEKNTGRVADGTWVEKKRGGKEKMNQREKTGNIKDIFLIKRPPGGSQSRACHIQSFPKRKRSLRRGNRKAEQVKKGREPRKSLLLPGTCKLCWFKKKNILCC